MESFRYIKPPDNLEDPTSYKMELIVDGQVVGEADVHYFSKPLPLFQISSLGVDFEKQNQGFASKLMDYIETYIKKRGRAGVLVHSIDTSSPAYGMYARRGWLEVPNSDGLHVFNLPAGATLDQFNGYASRYTDYELRSGDRNNID